MPRRIPDVFEFKPSVQLKEIEPKARTLAGKAGDWKKHKTRSAELLDIEPKTAWVVDYVDGQGQRHIETFDKKRDADARDDEIGVNVRKGVHTPANKSITVAKAADDWLTHVEREGRERATLAQYKQHVNLQCPEAR